MRRPAAGLTRGLVVVACLATLVACSDDDGSGAAAGTDPVEVEVGKAFTWNDFAVEDGWELTGIERSAGMDEKVVTPEVKGTIKNTSDEERTALFQMVFSADGSALATVNCSARSMLPDQSQQFVCPGLSATMPEDYDAVVVQEFSRDTTSG
ncbi:hypothetical protein [Nocardioides pinisoli]|uniref:Lipoprotein n=1 Tax=Nocardioides pinisoli TaxID=2950279 RepID=A0ABT1KYY5_9ACTN|nr:hypothetical protein [Nocardioides pinisoli]MCP3422962.1 hypothetical protein [Nocardioides pinisoli]